MNHLQATLVEKELPQGRAFRQSLWRRNSRIGGRPRCHFGGAWRVNQTKTGFYADLFFYPIVVGGWLLYDLNGKGFALHSRWWFAFVCGAILWTLVEYLLHRFVYHKVAIIKDLHGMHHSHPNDFIGAPIWVSIIGFSLFLCFLAWLWDIEIALGTTTGLMVGYVSYLLIHDAVHRWQLGERSLMRRHRLRHLLHHRNPVPGNFGVTTGFWDILFGTTILPERRREPRPDTSTETAPLV
jgi:sterol desaturase/sphingolipid hydroxylase (fatty acid hydroxylase superfamily)